MLPQPSLRITPLAGSVHIPVNPSEAMQKAESERQPWMLQ